MTPEKESQAVFLWPSLELSVGATLVIVPDLPGLPLIPLRNYLDRLSLMPGELSAELARGGFSNLTYLLQSGSERADRSFHGSKYESSK